MQFWRLSGASIALSLCLAAPVAGALRPHSLMYDLGDGVPKNDAEAVKWYRRAAEQGNAAAPSNLGVMYETGQGVTWDYAEAVKWWRKAAEQGLATALLHF